MRDYLIVLGREPELSVAELGAVARRLGLPLSVSVIASSLALAKGEINTAMLQALAGTIKVAEVLGEAQTNKTSLVDFLVSQVLNSSRYEFGLSWYPLTGFEPAGTPRWLAATGLELKSRLKKKGRHVRFVTSRTAALSSVVVKKNKLLPPSGFEFLLTPVADGKLLVARTIMVQDFAAWSERDYGRPERDARVGMLPPKLARLMLNLAEAKEGAGILDPFCGSGTILQEAALLGYRHLVGADADPVGIERTRVNFHWLKQKVQHLPEPTLLVSDINKLAAILNNSTFDAIVTEPYLGPALRGHETQARLRQIHSELTEFYQATLKVLAKVLKDDGRIVMIWPVIRAGRTNLTLPLLRELKEIGLMQVDPLPSEIPSSWHNSRNTMWYARPDARVIREIIILKKAKLG
jgi:tRNA (guanine10-N2)-dimethyltransferase